jgi:pyruvate dehydrogenase complex dehydrogenase (E1) component
MSWTAKPSLLLVMIRAGIIEITVRQNVRQLSWILSQNLGSRLHHFVCIALILQVLRSVYGNIQWAFESVSWRAWWNNVIRL